MLFFLEFSSLGWVGTEFGSKFFFFLFLSLSHPVCAKNNSRKKFLMFQIFLLFFFRNFLAGDEHERNSGLKFFSCFLGLSHLVLAKNNSGKRFFNFLNFLAFFFSEFPCTGRVWTEFRNKFFFSHSCPLPTRFGQK